MKVTVRITTSFKTSFKRLSKKYPSLSQDLLKLEKELVDNPRMGTSLGHNAYKIRLKISSKGKGKSGGAPVISLLESTIVGQMTILDEEITVNLLTIYDKANVASISDKELKDLIRIFHQDK